MPSAQGQQPQPNPQDKQLKEILAALQSIASAVTRGTDVLAGPAEVRPPSPQQSTTLVDYLVLRELVGRAPDETSRVVSALRFAGGVIAFPQNLPADVTSVAVFTARTGQPAETAIIDGTIVDLQATGSALGKPLAKGTSVGLSADAIVLGDVTDNQQIVRLELRTDDDRAVGLGPRLAAV